MFDFLTDLIRDIQQPVNRSGRPVVEEMTMAQARERNRQENIMSMILAQETMEAELDPKRKNRMAILISHGIYNFDGI